MFLFFLKLYQPVRKHQIRAKPLPSKFLNCQSSTYRYHTCIVSTFEQQADAKVKFLFVLFQMHLAEGQPRRQRREFSKLLSLFLLLSGYFLKTNYFRDAIFMDINEIGSFFFVIQYHFSPS